MSHMHEEFEVGQHLDQALRTAVTGLAQLVERIARRSADRSRETAGAQRDQIRQQQQQLRETQQLERDRARKMENDAREQARQAERDSRDRQAADRRAVLEQRDAARVAYGPWLREGSVERGDRVQASQAWARAAGWAEQDPRAAEAEKQLRDRITSTYGVTPAQILRSVEPGQGNPTGVAAGRPSVREAIELADKYAPHYYQLHHAKDLGRVGAMPANGVQTALATQWQQWAATGTLPHEVLVREWARHTGHGELLDTSKFDGADEQRDALEKVWQDGADARDAAEFKLHQERLTEAGMSTAAVDEAAGLSTRQRPDYEPYLDAGAFMTAEPEVAFAAWEAAAHAAVLHPDDPVINAAKTNLENKFRTRWQTDPATYLADRLHDVRAAAADRQREADHEVAAATDLQSAAGEEISSTADKGGYVMLHAGDANLDAGVAPTRAKSEEEKSHRAQTWKMVEEGWHAEQFDTRGQAASEADLRTEWRAVPEADRYKMFRDTYDTEAARKVWSDDLDKVVSEGRGVAVAGEGAAPAETVLQAEPANASLEHPVAAGAVAHPQRVDERWRLPQVESVTRAGGVDGGSLLSESALKDMDSGALVLTLQSATEHLPEQDRARINDAAQDAAWLHRDQLRGNRAGLPRTPYVEHPLRNTVRLARWGVTDSDVLVASLLHDAPEDQDQQIAQLRRGPEAAESMSAPQRRDEAIGWVKDKYGDRVAGIVEAVSNPVAEGPVSREEQVASYRAHVSSAIAADPAAGLVKWADFVDNAGSLHHNELNEKTAQRAAKYEQLVPVWREQLQDVDGALAQLTGTNSVREFSGQLEHIHERLDTINTSAQQQASRARTVELNEQAATFYGAQLPGSRAERTFRERLGPESMQGPWRVGYAPAGWTTLTDHLKAQGASEEEIVTAGLGMVTKRGNVVDVFRDRAMVAVRDAKGEVIGFTGRDVSTADIAPERLGEINDQAAEFYAGQLPGSAQAQKFHAEQPNPAAEQGYAPGAWTDLTRHLQQQGATDQELVASGLGQISSKGNVIDRLRDRAVEVVRDEHGRVTGFVGHDLSGAANAPATVSTVNATPRHMNTGDTPAFRKGSAIFGAYEAQQARDNGQLRAIGRAEGALDAMAIGLSADRQVFGVAPMGTALTGRQANAIAALAGERPVLSALDRDAGGQKAAANDFALLSARGVAVHDMPMTRNDPAEMRQHDRGILDGVVSIDPELHPLLGETVIAETIDVHREGAFFTDDQQQQEAGDQVADLVAGAAGPDRERLEVFARRELNASGGQPAVDTFNEALAARDNGEKQSGPQPVQRADERQDLSRTHDRPAEQGIDTATTQAIDVHRAGPQNRDDATVELPYSRAGESPRLRELSPEARAAVTTSGHGYSQSTGAMLAGGRKANGVWDPKRETNSINQSAARSKGVRR